VDRVAGGGQRATPGARRRLVGGGHRTRVTAEHTVTIGVTFEDRGDTESPQLGLGRLYELSPVTEAYGRAPDDILLYGTDIPWTQPTPSESC